MNIIVRTFGGKTVARSDTTWDRKSEDFFPPESVQSLSCVPILTGRVSKTGKCVSGRFAGRYFDVHINSLNYEEFLQFYALQDSDESLTVYLRWGGLPFLAQIPMADTKVRTDYLGSIYDTIFVKDVITRRKVRNVTMMDNLARFVADNTGKIFSANSIAKYLKGKENTVSANTVGEYMEAWCESYMIDKVKRYDIKGKLVFEQQEKYYFEDLGIRNYLCGSGRR